MDENRQGGLLNVYNLGNVLFHLLQKVKLPSIFYNSYKKFHNYFKSQFQKI